MMNIIADLKSQIANFEQQQRLAIITQHEAAGALKIARYLLAKLEAPLKETKDAPPVESETQ